MKPSITDEFLWRLYKASGFVGDFLSILLLPPRTMGQVFVRLDEISQNHHGEREEFMGLLHRLRRKGYIKVGELEGKKAVMITRDGVKRTLKASFRMEDKILRKDGRWTMLIFDMPAKRKRPRDLLRSILKNLGYKMFQQSVWITPYDVLEKTEKLLKHYSLEKYVKIFLVEKI